MRSLDGTITTETVDVRQNGEVSAPQRTSVGGQLGPLEVERAARRTADVPAPPPSRPSDYWRRFDEE